MGFQKRILCLLLIWTIRAIDSSTDSSLDTLDSVDAVSSVNTSDFVATQVDISDNEQAYTVVKNVQTSSPFDVEGCRLESTDPYLYNKIMRLLDYKVKLIEYKLSFSNYSSNPLLVNTTWSYRSDLWARVSSQHGQTLLSLAFNYGILSMMTLTFGVETMEVDLVDLPAGCIWTLSEEDKIDAVMHLLMRDFKRDDEDADDDAVFEDSGQEDYVVTLVEDERVCHEVILNVSGYAKFTDRCCMIDRITEEQFCDSDLKNFWLSLLYSLLAVVKFAILFVGPLLFIPMIEAVAKVDVPYVVKLKDPLVKTILPVKSENTTNVKSKHVLDLRKVEGYPKFKRAIDALPMGEPTKVKFTQYDILVSYKKLMTENSVPVGVFQCLTRAIFQCKLKHSAPFTECCETNITRSIKPEVELKWIKVWEKIARLLLLFLVPSPYYLRVLIFYTYEYPEVLERDKAMQKLGLEKRYEGGLLHYLTPIHPLFISIYCLYFFTAAVLAFLARRNNKGVFRSILLGSFNDLKTFSWLSAIQMLTSNIVWPFRRFGVLGCVVVIFYWPIVIPLSVFVCILYCLPSIYITLRMLIYSRKTVTQNVFSGVVTGTDGKGGKYSVEQHVDTSIKMFEVGHLFKRSTNGANATKVEEEEEEEPTGFHTYIPPCIQLRKTCVHFLVSILCIITMFAVLIMMSECIGFTVELIVFTMMGVIVNAGSMLKYTTLIFLVLVYSYDTYNNVEKKYMKLNKSLFNEVKGRIKDIADVTSLPSYLQENQGFKAQELNEQADYEIPDTVSEKEPRHWLINDLVLFIDSEDMPRIPCKLFEDVCGIKVAGAPGPIYLSLLEATKHFLMIVGFLMFVFIVVLSFGEVYQISTTNQMLATMAGGFLPFILKTFMQPTKPDIELGTVSFKSKLDEIIKNFLQMWPMFDLPFEVYEENGSQCGDANDDSGIYPDVTCHYPDCNCLCKHVRSIMTQTEESNSDTKQLNIPRLTLEMPTPTHSLSKSSVNAEEPSVATTEVSNFPSKLSDSTSTSHVMPQNLVSAFADKTSIVADNTPDSIGKIQHQKKTANVTPSSSPVVMRKEMRSGSFFALNNISGNTVHEEFPGIKKITDKSEFSTIQKISTPTLPRKQYNTGQLSTSGSTPRATPTLSRKHSSPLFKLPDKDTPSKPPFLKKQSMPLITFASIDSDSTPGDGLTPPEKHSLTNGGAPFKSPREIVSPSDSTTPLLLSIENRLPREGPPASGFEKDKKKDIDDSRDDDDGEVDLLIYLPDSPDNDLWLKEWSSIGLYDSLEGINVDDNDVQKEDNV